MMLRARNRKIPKVVKARKFKPFFPSLHSFDQDSPISHKFVEDISLAIMPSRHVSSGKYEVEIVGDKSVREQVISLLECLCKYGRYEIDELLSDAIERVAYHIAYQGRTTHEITSDPKNSDFSLHNVTERNLYRIPGYFIQHVPKQDREAGQKPFVVVSDECVWEVEMPKMLGGVRQHKRTLRTLQNYHNIGPKFYTDALEKGDSSQSYDFKMYTKEVDLLICRATRTWGWDYSDRYSTEFAHLYKKLTFRWVQAVLRDHILTEFNTLLDRLNLDAKVHVEGLRTPAEFLRIRNELSDGSTEFKCAYDAVM